MSEFTWPKGKKFGELTRAQQRAAMNQAVAKLVRDPALHAAIAAVIGVPVDKVSITAKQEEK